MGRKVTLLLGRRRWKYVLRDLFSTPHAAPLPSPLACSPGPGQWTVVDTASKLSVSGGYLLCSGGKGAPAYRDPGVFQTVAARAAGRALLSRAAFSNDTKFSTLGWINRTTDDVQMFKYQQGLWVIVTGLVAETPGLPIIGQADTSEHLLVVVQRAAGAFFLLDGVLVWVGNAGGTDLGAGFSNYDATVSIAYIETVNVPTWNADDKVYTSKLTNPAGGATGTMTPDAWVEINLTYQGATNADFYLRSTDDDNNVVVTASSDGGVYVFRHQAGGWTQIGFAAGCFVAGNTYRIVAVLDGSSIQVYVGDASKIKVTEAFNQGATGVKVQSLGGGSCSSLICWPRRPGFPKVP